MGVFAAQSVNQSGHAHTGPQENDIQVCVLQQSADHTGLSAAVLQGTDEWDAGRHPGCWKSKEEDAVNSFHLPHGACGHGLDKEVFVRK